MDTNIIFNFVLNLFQIISNIENSEGGLCISQEDTWPGAAAAQVPVWRRGVWSRVVKCDMREYGRL